MKKCKQLFAGLLAVGLLLSATGCSGDTTWVYKTENDTVPAGVYLSYLQSAYSDAQNQIDTEKDIWSQTIDDVPVEQWIINKASELTKQYIAVNLMFEDLGMTLGTEGANVAKTKADNYWSQNQSTYEANGISYASVQKLCENDYKTQKVFDYYYETNGVEAVSEDTIKEYFYDNFAKVKYLAVNRYDIKTGDKKDADELQKTVDGYVTEINKGTDIDEIIDAYITQVYKDYGLSDYEPDTSDSSRNVSLISKAQTGNLESFAKKTFEQTEYAIPYVDDSNSNYIYLGERFDLTKDSSLYEKNRSSVLYQLRGDAYTKKLTDRLASVEITTNDEAVNRYSPKNLKVGS